MGSERYLLDAMLGKLATYLRMCGDDAAYALDRGVEADDRLLVIASEEGRTVLTRDRSLAASAPDSLLIESHDVREQLRELVDAGFDLTPAGTPTRCGRCNDRLEAVPEAGSTPEYAPDPSAERVWRCEGCDQCFWKGSHWDDVAETLSEL
ncbi:Mut7-C RNAse domain-containing protein [Halorhabdus amylolytica]|uniref:Mut7-C RNAse domain-containing protein n=1 Tax=Halorhabdus amylolytica TaxID=2559573 RepID=UPI0010AA0B4C|nr:Mut7-C RNAse domain-containing protein [Halorhabdus amylolytica]